MDRMAMARQAAVQPERPKRTSPAAAKGGSLVDEGLSNPPKAVSGSWDFSRLPVLAPGQPQTSSLLHQPKLAIGPVDDPFEQEADRVADQVMRMQRPDLSRMRQAPQGTIQRQPTGRGRQGVLPPPPPHELSELHRQIEIVGEPQIPNDVLKQRENLSLQGSDLDELFSTRKLKAIFKLGDLKDERAVITLIAVIEDKVVATSRLPPQKKSLVQQAAADALAKIGGTAALTKLNDLLNSPTASSERQMAARGLSEGTGSQAATMLLARLKKETDAGVKGSIIVALGNVGGSLGNDQEKQLIVKELVRQMEGNIGSLKVSAINAMGRIKHKSATDPLLQQLRARMSNVPIARDIVTALGEIRDPNAVELLAILLRDHGDPSVRGESAIALGKIGGTKALEVLRSRLKLEKDARVQANIQQAIP